MVPRHLVTDCRGSDTRKEFLMDPCQAGTEAGTHRRGWLAGHNDIVIMLP